MFPSEIATLKVFSLNSMDFLTFDQIFSIIFGFLEALPQTPPGALYPAGDGTHSFVPLRNKFLATPLGVSGSLPHTMLLYCIVCFFRTVYTLVIIAIYTTY